MVRNYKRKTTKGSYSKHKLHAAVLAVQNGTLTGYKAAQLYQIPRTTIMDHVHKKSSSSTLGRKTTLPLSIEQNLASCLRTMEKYGFGLSRAEVSKMVGEYVNQNNLTTCFKNGIPGKDWLASFRNRNNLSVKKPQAVEYARKTAVDPFVVYEYFDLLKSTIVELGLEDKPNAIWNLDETSFSKDPSKTKIVGLKGHAATRVIATPGKDNTTVLLGASAIGEKTPPLIVFKGKYVWDEWTSPDAFPGTTYAATKNGWMQTEVFEAFFKKSFLPTIGDQRPVLLIYDGHSTHVGLNLIEEARKENVTILKLPAHTSHILQPLDISVMKSFKDRWDIDLVKWQRLNYGVPLSKKEFSRMIGSVWAQIDPQILCNGFKKGGIYPFNPAAVEESKFDALKLSRWKEHIRTTETQENPHNPALSVNDLHNFVFSEIPVNDVICDIEPTTINTKAEPHTLLLIVLNFLNQNFIATDNVVKTGKLMMMNDDIDDRSNHLDLRQPMEKKNVTFEELLLQKIKRGDNSKKIKRCRVAPGAEVITHDDVIQLKREKQIKNIKKENFGKRKSRSSPAPKRTDDVVMLSKTLMSNTESQPFIAEKVEDLPRCLKNQIVDSHKIKILSNIVLNNPTVPDEERLLTEPGPSGIHKVNTPGKRRGINRFAATFEINNKKKTTTITPKGKGIGKKSKKCIGKENKRQFSHDNKEDTYDDFKFLGYRKQKKHEMSSTSSTTSVSGTISSHSDSDIINAVSDYDSNDECHSFLGDTKLPHYINLGQREDTILIQDKEAKNENITNIISNNDTEYEYEQTEETILLQHEETDNKSKIEFISNENSYMEQEYESYSVNEHVLVKYYVKKKWTYYVGVIDAVYADEQTNEPYFSIKFYKTVKTPKLTFKITRIIDRDEVPYNSIVKRINLSKDPERRNDFFLNDEDDTVFFS